MGEEMKRKKLPYMLKGEFSWVKNNIKKVYKNNVELLESDDEWYKNVISNPDKTWFFLYDANLIFSDLELMFNYVEPSEEQMSHVEEKYGERHPYFAVIEYLLVPLYQRAYDKALMELKSDS